MRGERREEGGEGRRESGNFKTVGWQYHVL
jgi:hypothetical protein